MKKYTAKQLNKLPTLCISQSYDLKIEKPNTRVWLSRCKIEDGEPFNNKISIEKFVDNKWQITEEYQG